MAKKKSKKGSKSNGKKGPKAWGKNLYGETHRRRGPVRDKKAGAAKEPNTGFSDPELDDEENPDHPDEGSDTEAGSSVRLGDSKKKKKKIVEDSKRHGTKKGSNSGLAMAKAGKLWPVLDGTDNIRNFIKQMTEKNYAEANKYLHGALEDKTRARIANAAGQK